MTGGDLKNGHNLFIGFRKSMHRKWHVIQLAASHQFLTSSLFKRSLQMKRSRHAQLCSEKVAAGQSWKIPDVKSVVDNRVKLQPPKLFVYHTLSHIYGFVNLWGRRGEGIDEYFIEAIKVREVHEFFKSWWYCVKALKRIYMVCFMYLMVFVSIYFCILMAIFI